MWLPIPDLDPYRKISREFAGRLSALPEDRPIRVVLLLGSEKTQSRSGKRQSADERQAALRSLKRSVGENLRSVDEILAEHAGKRLDREVSSLGTVAVEVRPAGIRALVSCEGVRAILEDQQVSPLGSTRPRL